ncbi:MAG: hypothetical protein A3J63_04600 [Candidatus Moranbacteria bacterium RIFCSPHIGHO2_02_FULL_40_12b]|nr:MAG: hypothetical protein A3J63_04600 [Candidatus Moranbacteria bacterium RIFCSPHIGHO2_02_FULL_40_12b]OGI23364.1 MAG: hypothetical protein A3E91_00690 [Candidatus Moranbacteria bacterium RIFCSPHIGHO2_12_FULL_40_10]
MENLEKISEKNHISSEAFVEIAEKEAKENIKKAIMELKECSDNNMIKSHLKLVDINKLTDYDLMAFNESIVKNAWEEKSKELEAYLDNVKGYEKIKKQEGNYNPLTDSRCNFSTMIKHYLIDKAIGKKLSGK